MFKRIALFLAANLAIIIVISIILSIFNVKPYLTQAGLDYQSLLIYAVIIGFTGSFISLFISKWMAKMAYNIQIIQQPSNSNQALLVATIEKLCRQVGIRKPEIGIYESPEPNAFATGWNRNNALVAVSTGLLQIMNQDEIEGVLGHEISHVANGDMVTLSLIQGVVNTFVIFFARVAAFFVTQFLRRNDDESPVGGFAYYGIAILFELLFGILASMIVMWFSRYREFRADAGSARITSKEKMISALRRLQQASELPVDNRAPSMDAFKISSPSKVLHLFASHPPIEKRIAAIQQMK